MNTTECFILVLLDVIIWQDFKYLFLVFPGQTTSSANTLSTQRIFKNSNIINILRNYKYESFRCRTAQFVEGLKISVKSVVCRLCSLRDNDVSLHLPVCRKQSFYGCMNCTSNTANLRTDSHKGVGTDTSPLRCCT